jgi:hypothetical protein
MLEGNGEVANPSIIIDLGGTGQKDAYSGAY